MANAPHIGIDGGGSGSRACLRLPDGQEHVLTGGPANAYSDLPGAVRHITELVDRLCHRAGIPRPQAIVAGIAGCRLPQIAGDMAKHLPFTAQIFDDSVTAMAGALGAADGTVIGLGTGAFAIRRSGADIMHIDGWGFHLGDVGSAAWLGQMAVRATLRAEDGLCPPCPLTRAIMAATQPHPLLFFRAAQPGDFAALAPLVLAHAETSLARELLAEIAASIRANLTALGTQADEPIVYIGGFADAMLAHLPQDLAARVQAPLGTPLAGALMMAADM